MKPSKSSANTRSAILGRLNASCLTRHSEGAVEIDVTPSLTCDVRFLGVSLQYPYMFANPLGQLTIERQWSAAFRLTCREIDAFLGQDKRGFHWRQLDMDDGQPHWYWSLGKDYDHQVYVLAQEGGPGVGLRMQPRAVIVKPEADPRDELRHGIRYLVDTGIKRAAFFHRDVPNTGELQ